MTKRLTTNERHAADSMLFYLDLYQVYESGTTADVSPALVDFFATVNIDAPFLLNWARWLRMNLQRDDCGLPVSVSHAVQLVETRAKSLPRQHAHLADQMRRALREEPLNQLDLF